MTKKTLSQLIVDKIVEVNGPGNPVFGICGIGTVNIGPTIQQAMEKNLLSYFYTSNESSGINVASYWGAVTDKVGVHFCTSGPGVTMAISGIDSAFNEGKPCVIITAQPFESYFEFVDPRIMTYLSSACFSIKDEHANAEGILNDAFRIAKYGTRENPKSGPVVLFVTETLWLTKYPTSNLRVSKPIWRQDVSHFLGKVRHSINSNSKVILRIGNSVSVENTRRLVELTTQFPNFYVHLTYKSKAFFNGINTMFPNVGIEGNLGNPITNKNYQTADVVLSLGLTYNETYYLFNYGDLSEITPKSTKLWYVINGVELFPPKYLTKTNSIVTETNFFVQRWLDDVARSYEPPSVSWTVSNVHEKNMYWWKILEKYIRQEERGFLTTASFMAQVLYTIYRLQQDNTYAIIDDNTVYCTDAGTSSFIFFQLLNHSRPMHQVSFFQFDPIGIGSSGLAGHLKSGKYRDGFLILGDGGFTNSPGYFMELTNVVGEFPHMRCLILLVNDKTYTNVKIEEIQEFGHSTVLSSTRNNQRFINYFDLLKAFTGNLLRESLNIENLRKPSDKLATFMTNWYLRKPGFDKNGFYIINYVTPATPVFFLADGKHVP